MYDSTWDKFISITIFILLAIACLLSPAFVNAQSITYRHACKDAGEQIISECTMRYSQAASFAETKAQIKLALKNTRFRKKIRFISIDPFPSGSTWDNERDYYFNMYVRNGGSIEYGVWYRTGRVYIAAMPGCRNIRLLLEALLRDISKGKAKQLPFPKRAKQLGLAQYLRGEAPVFPNLELPEYLK